MSRLYIYCSWVQLLWVWRIEIIFFSHHTAKGNTRFGTSERNLLIVKTNIVTETKTLLYLKMLDRSCKNKIYIDFWEISGWLTWDHSVIVSFLFCYYIKDKKRWDVPLLHPYMYCRLKRSDFRPTGWNPKFVLSCAISVLLFVYKIKSMFFFYKT